MNSKIETFNYGKKISRDEYFEIQVERSRKKYSCCRVSILDAVFMWKILCNNQCPHGPMICMGTRNGREVDLFRIARSCSFRKKLVYLFETKRHVFSSLLPIVESIGRSAIDNIDDSSVIGVEINPDAKRQDILIGSFDKLPPEYENRFSIVYSNSLDQALYPEQTASEWKRILKDGGFIVLHYKENDKAFYTDPTGGLNVDSLCELFAGNIIHQSKSNMDSCNPDNLIIRIIKS